MKRVPISARRAPALRVVAWTLAAVAGLAGATQLRSLAFSTPESLNTLGAAYTQNFDTLATTGTSSALPNGWGFLETGTNANLLYNTGTGSGNAGDTYSFGAAGSSERAFGGLLSGSLVPTVGARFTNNTGGTIQSIIIGYTGEQWRVGTLARLDRLDFQYSLDATALNNGTWNDVNELDFVAPVTAGVIGARDGNAAGNRTVLSHTITGLTIAPGATFAVRWTDFNATGADDGLAVDDFSLTPLGGGTTATNPTGTASASPSPVLAGNTALLTVAVTPGANPTSTGLAVAGDLSPISGSATQALFDTGTNGDVTAGDGTFSFLATVDVATTGGSKTLNFTITDAEARTGAASTSLVVTANVVTTPINQIQGSGASSPLLASTVTTTGIVTGVKSNGFFIQAPDAQADADPLTSEGIFVFTAGAPPAAAAVGNAVQVTGTVAEFASAADPGAFPLTELTFATVTLMSSGNPLPAPVTVTAFDTPAGTSSTFYPLEKYEGMLVTVPSLTVVAPTEGFVTEPTATSASNGVFFGVVTGMARPFREAGIDAFLAVPPGAGANVPRWDSNLERIRVDSDGLAGVAPANVGTGQVLTNVTGVLDYGFRTYTILPTVAIPSGSGFTARSVAPARTDEIRIGSLNLERFFDNVNDPAIGDPVLTLAAFENRLNKAMLTVRDVLRRPDVLGVVEVENLSTLQALATTINTGAGTNYQAFLVEGNDVGGIDVGFLVNAATTTAVEVTQFGKDATYTDPSDGSLDLLNDRPPLVLRATALPAGHTTPIAFTVIVNHLRSLGGVDEDPGDGPRVRAKRAAQAEYLAQLVQDRLAADPAEKIILVGDFNAFQFNDGYVDSMGTIAGTPAPADQVTLATDDPLNLATLTNLVDAELPGERYSFVFDGSAQTLDHVLVTPNVLPLVTRFEHGRSNADFPESERNDPNSPLRLSDHDGVVVRLAAGAPKIAGAAAGVDPGRTWIDVRYTNTGSGNALATQISSATIRVLAGSGAVSIATPMPVVLGTLAPGQSLVVRYAVNIAPWVTRVSLTASGSMQTVTGTTLRFSSGQAVLLPAVP